MSKEKLNFRIQFIAVIIGVTLMIIKFLAYHLTNSNAIFSDAMESIINVAAGSFALYSLWLSNIPKDRGHPYGHGKIEFLSSGLEGILIIIAGIGIIYKSIEAFIHPNELGQVDIGIILTGVAGTINFGLGYVMERTGKKNNSIVLEAEGKHLKTDAYSTFVLIVALLAIYVFHINWLDSAFAGVFGLFIIYTGIKVIRKSVAGIMDEADFDALENIIEILNRNRKDNWVDLHNLRAIKYGDKIHIDCHVTLPWYNTLEESHKEIHEIEKLVNEHLGRKAEMFIHMDSCVPESCQVCVLKNCPERQAEMTKKIDWSLDNTLTDKKHT